MFVGHFSKKLKLKADGPCGVERPGTLFYLKRRITFDEGGLEIAANKKYVPKLIAVCWECRSDEREVFRRTQASMSMMLRQRQRMSS